MANSTTSLNTFDWQTLRQEGLAHLQAISGQIWTDYSIHDPGVTLLELLCYAITDLDSRLEQDISTIVTENAESSITEHYFSPGQILTTNPVTINDYRKLLIDLPGVKNAWLISVTESEPALYYDKDNNAILYDYASGSERLALNGLYRVYIEKEEEVDDEAALKKAVEEKLHEHRNLCEDFVEIHIMEEETISVYSDIRIDEKADANEIMAQIYYDLKNFISPRIRQYSLKRMLQKGKTIEEIFTGPQLENGFIDDDELGTGTKLKELHTSDLIRIIMAHSEVKDVKNLFITNVPNPDVRDKQEWALVVDSTKALVMEAFNGSNLRLFKNDTLCPISSTAVASAVARLAEEESREIFDNPEMDLTEPLGEISDILTEYSSISYKLPAVYGVSETGLPSTVSDLRRAQAKQLRAYLLFFEQILVNYLKQLDSFKRLFAFRQNREELLKSYFSRLLPEAIWKSDFPESKGMIENDPTESLPFCETAFKRKSRILDHLLAQFNEKFADYAVFGYKYNISVVLENEKKEAYYLNAKADFLENYPKLSQNRNKAYNYLAHSTQSSQTDGLKNLIASKLGIDLTVRTDTIEESEEIYLVEHILFRPDGSMPLDFICSERITEDYQPEPYSYQLTYLIPKKAGRFGNSKFKELFYATIDNETPAHITYTVLEFTADQMSSFSDIYQHFLVELVRHKQGNSPQYNYYRNELMELLEIGRPRLPVLHLDATQVSGTETEPADESPVSEWTDLSGNNHPAISEGATSPVYKKTGMGAKPSIHLNKDSQLRVADGLVQDDLTVVAVFKTPIQTGQEKVTFNLVQGQSNGFQLGFRGNGDIVGGIAAQTIFLESEAESPHLAMFIRDRTAGEIRLYLDGVLQTSQQLTVNSSLSDKTVILAPWTACDIGEVIILDSVLTGSRKENLEEYISEKWNIPLSAVSSIAKPALHLDANTAIGFIKDEVTNKIGSWIDLSVNKKSATQATTALQPVYVVDGIAGLPAVYFKNAALVIPNSSHDFFKSDFTIALVYQADAGDDANAGCLLDGTAVEAEDSKSFTILVGTQGTVSVAAETEKVAMAADLGQAHFAFVLGRVISDKLQVTLWIDGKYHVSKEFQDVRAFSDCPLDLVVGRSRDGHFGFNGKIGEIVFFDEALSVWDRQRLEEFLSEKWQIDISGVNPVAIPILHLDASRQRSVLDESGAVLDRDTHVYQWLDQSDSGNNVVQNTVNRRPTYVVEGLNGLGTIQFTQKGVDTGDLYEDSLSIDRVIQDDFTIMALFQPDKEYYTGKNLPAVLNVDTDWTEGVAIIDADCSGSFNDFGISFGKVGEKMVVMGGIGDRLSLDNTVKTKTMNFNAPHFISLTRAKADGVVKLYADGLFQAQADLRDDVILNDSRSIKIGAFNSEGEPFRGLIGEIIIFDQALSDEKRQQIESYLSAKWQIPIVTLPVDTTGLELHLDASVATTITKDADNRVSKWSDPDSFRNVTAIQTVTEYQPEYVTDGLQGMPALQFNNSSMEVAPAAASFDDLTVAVVFQAVTTGNLYPGWDEAGLIDHYNGGTDNNFGIVITRNNTLGARVGVKRTESELSLNLPHIAVISRDKAEGKVQIYLDGLLKVTETDDTVISLNELGELTLGAIRLQTGEKFSKGYYHGMIAEVLAFNRILADSERQNVEDYFSRKWRIDLSGINNIAKPVLHLDASKLETIVSDAAAKISQWLDLDGRSNYAVQTDPVHQPEYKENSYNGLGTVHFDREKQTFMTLKPSVQDDFSVIIVYEADGEAASEYMPVSQNAFTVIAGVDSSNSAKIWTYFKDSGYIDEYGNVLPAFLPGNPDFALALDASVTSPIKNEFKKGIDAILRVHFQTQKAILEDAFTSIGGVDPTLSESIWKGLEAEGYITGAGKALKNTYEGNSDGFLNSVVEGAILTIVLTENWLEGVGLFDGNCAGSRGQLNMRDFGILVGKDGQFTAGIGVPDDADHRISQGASFGRLHVGALTRIKDTGITRIYVDGVASEGKKIARNLTLKDSKQFTIGAVNTGGNYLTGEIAEIIVLDKVLTEEELAAVHNYLIKKWGITL